MPDWSKYLCIYHGNCQDGYAAAWVLHHLLGDDMVDFFPGVYQQAPPDVTNRHVIMVDFSYKRPVIEDMQRKAQSVLILDHHKSAEEDLRDLPDAPPNFSTWAGLVIGAPLTGKVFDMDRSGAEITWDWMSDNSRPPVVLKHIGDRDLWRFKLPRTKAISAALFSYPYDMAVWDELMWQEERLFNEGGALLRKQAQDIANLLPVVQRSMKIGGMHMPVANLPITMTSDAGHEMATKHPGQIAACYWDTEAGRIFSLRSTDDGPDCQAIATRYGGGGHPHAAGFRMPANWEGENG